MSEWLNTLHWGYRWLHIALGLVGLALFWVTVLAPKGSRLHRTSGIVFASIGYYVAGTGLVSCIWGLLDPWSFIGRQPESIRPEAHAAILENVLFLFSILLVLSLSVLTALTFGLLAVRTRNQHERMRHPLLLLLEAATLVAGIGVFAYGVWQLYQDYFVRTAEAGNLGQHWILAVFGAIFVSDIVRDLRYLFGPAPPPNTWVIKHMEAMCGVGIAFYTAFAVFGFTRLIPVKLPGAWMLLPWIVPTVIGAPLIVWTKRRWERKLGLSKSSGT